MLRAVCYLQFVHELYCGKSALEYLESHRLRPLLIDNVNRSICLIVERIRETVCTVRLQFEYYQYVFFVRLFRK